MQTRFVKGACDKGTRSIYLVPRRELVYQTCKTMKGFGVEPGIIMAGEPMDVDALAQVASFDTLLSRAIRKAIIALPPAKLVQTDEGHLALTEKRIDIITRWMGATHLGWSATPANLRGRPLRALYTKLIVGPSVRELQDDGFLVEVRCFAPSEPDMKKLRKSSKTGDYTQKSAAEQMMQPKMVGDVVDNWLAIAPGESTVVFCVNQAHARAVCKKFREAGVRAETVFDDTPKEERKAIFARVNSGETTVLVNVFVASYGLDIPRISCVVLARPTKSLVLYLQMIGRGLRPWFIDELIEQVGLDLSQWSDRMAAIALSGKTECKVIDHSGAVTRLGFPDEPFPWTLDGDEDVAEARQQQREERREPKLLTCPKCHKVFKGARFCPGCGYEFVPPGADIPMHQGELRELVRDGNKANRKEPWDVKAEFFAQAMGWARSKRYDMRFAMTLYREKYGVDPTDPRVKYVVPKEPAELIKGFLAHRAMKRNFSGGKRRAIR